MTVREIIREYGAARLFVNGILGAVCIYAFLFVTILGGVAAGVGP